MTYKHPKAYKGISNQDRARQMVEENCLMCENFMGQEHDFTECNLKKLCFEGFKHPSIFYAKDFVKMEIEGI